MMKKITNIIKTIAQNKSYAIRSDFHRNNRAGIFRLLSDIVCFHGER